ncbi:glycine oxidase ThiO [Nesterenkonia marinintestina]|uniref:glycine oxidase ThiO n=1 Tax=Nesterenkonia marinintestina TaxID=2979865 RepID=UPI0021BE0B2A|nr:glycine oxidase ThiO [Nesterenkonia sp. GX14115]
MHVAVVGAGVIGLLTAWELIRSDHRVTVVAPEIGHEASYAAAGMLAPVSEVQYGQDRLWAIMAAARAEYPDLLASLSEATDAPTGFHENGTLLLAADRSDRDAVARLVDVQQAHGMDVAPLTGTALRRREPSLAPGLAKAWEVPSDHQVDPRMLMRCTVDALTDAGAEFVTARVTEVGTVDDGLRVSLAPADADVAPLDRTGSETLTADKVLLAPGLGYGDIAGLPDSTPLDLRPIHGDVLRLRVTEDQLMSGEQHIVHATVRALVAGRSVYLVPRADGGLVVGASSREDGLTGTRTGAVQELLDDAVRVLPAVRETELVEVTTRARPGTPDDIPYLGRLPDHDDVVVSTGYSRHGILLAPLAARLGAALLTGAALDEDDRRMLDHMSPTRRTRG